MLDNKIYALIQILLIIILLQCNLYHCQSVAIGKKKTSSLQISKPIQIPAASSTTTTTKPIQLRNLSPKDAAISMNSIEFLKELVRKKDTFHERYYAQEVVRKEDGGDDTYSSSVVVVEYTGRLWFMKNKNKHKHNGCGGIRFQESVRIRNVSKCGTSSTVECITKYKKRRQNNSSSKNSKGNDGDCDIEDDEEEWIDCSKVLCTFSSADDDHDDTSRSDSSSISRALRMNIGSEILLRIPLLGIGGAVKRQISDTFEVATQAFLRQKMQDME